MNAMDELDHVKEQLIKKYSPAKIILFGSLAKGTNTKRSDIDLCIVKDTENKKEFLMDIYLNIESEKILDILVYTEKEWNDCIKDTTSFAYLIKKKGIEIYG